MTSAPFFDVDIWGAGSSLAPLLWRGMFFFAFRHTSSRTGRISLRVFCNHTCLCFAWAAPGSRRIIIFSHQFLEPNFFQPSFSNRHKASSCHWVELCRSSRLLGAVRSLHQRSAGDLFGSTVTRAPELQMSILVNPFMLIYKKSRELFFILMLRI